MSEGKASGAVEPEANMSLKAVVIGATGATGRFLVGELVQSKNFSNVVVLVRRNTTIIPESFGIDQSAAENEGKLQQVVVDFETLTKDTVSEHFQGRDVFFSTLGTTRKIAGSAEAFKHIDHGYTMKCAEIARSCDIPHMSLLTSTGSNHNSYFLYMRTKGEIEEDSKKLNFNYLSIFRPGLLDRGGEKRFVEKLAGWFVSSLSVGVLAKAMKVDAEQFAKTKATKESDDTASKSDVQFFDNNGIKNLSEDST